MKKTKLIISKSRAQEASKVNRDKKTICMLGKEFPVDLADADTGEVYGGIQDINIDIPAAGPVIVNATFLIFEVEVVD